MRLFSFLAVILAATSAMAQTICIDPGHPSENGVGTHGKAISEVHAAWVVALKLEKRLEADGYTVVMTKSAEMQRVTNKRRATIANDAKASLMVRIHCDAGSKSGFATYYPGEQGSVGGIRGPSVQVIDESRTAAAAFHRAVISSLNGAIGDGGLHTDAATNIGGKQRGALTGSIYSKVPVLLVEMAVLQNRHDDEFIASSKGQEIMSRALEQGVKAALAALGGR